jgi:type IX secretion system PorP/SprF family membrane protein
MRNIFYILFFLTITVPVLSQDVPLNGQIFLNPYYYNPAYAGFEDRPAFYVYRRQQWTGIPGAPVTAGFNFHTIFKEKVNFGVNIMNDKRSILSTSKALLTFGYRASFDEFHYLSFGLSGGVGFNSIDLNEVDPDDPAIVDALDNNIFLDGNAGINYYNKGFNLGFSLPKIFKTSTLSSSSFTQGEISPLNDAILMSSYKWQISEDKFAVEPYFIYYYNIDMPGQFEIIGLLHFMNAIWIGGSYRQEYGTSALVGINIKDNFKFGYAYEFFSASPASFNNNTHDLQLALIFGEKKKKGKVNLMQQRRNMLQTMGRTPTQQTQTRYQVEKDPFVQPAPKETYSEEDALKDLLKETTTPVVAPVTVPEPEPQPKMEPKAEPKPEETYSEQQALQDLLKEAEIPVVVPVPVPEPEPIVLDNEENELIRQMDEGPEEEITFSDLDELTDYKIEADDAPVFVEPTLNDAGMYIGPKTVTKGDHLLELNKGNYVVVGTYGSYREAEEYSDALFIKGFYTKFGYISQTKIYYVYIFESEDLEEATDTSTRFRDIGAQFRENWVLQVQ